jgi:hypothetical protein
MLKKVLAAAFFIFVTTQMTGCGDQNAESPEQIEKFNTEIRKAKDVLPELKDTVEKMTITSQRIQRRHYIVSFNSVDPLIEKYNESLLYMGKMATRTDRLISEAHAIERLPNFVKNKKNYMSSITDFINDAVYSARTTAEYMRELELKINKFNIEFDLNYLKNNPKYREFTDQKFLDKSAYTIETALRENRPDDAINAFEQLKLLINS